MNQRLDSQRGASLVVVLILLMVMLMGGLSLARMTEIGALVSGNVAFKERALQASEVGINTAFQAIQALAEDEGENVDKDGWYFAAKRDTDPATGMPTNIDWEATVPAAQVLVGGSNEYDVRYVVDRMCSLAAVTDPETECLLKQANTLKSAKGGDGSEAIDPPSGKQFRITVRVIGPKSTTTFVQALVTRG